MRKMILGAAMVAAVALAAPLAGQAQVIQDTVNGAQNGVDQGNAAAGPLGGIVGGAVGAGIGAATGAVGTATGVVGSILGAGDRPRFHTYAEGRPSYNWDGDVRVGTILPPRGVVLYPVPRDYRMDHRYRFARINDQTVIVDPRTRRIVEVID